MKNFSFEFANGISPETERKFLTLGAWAGTYSPLLPSTKCYRHYVSRVQAHVVRV